MTDRLTTLLHSEAETLDVPPVPTAEILGSGRRLRRRRSRTVWATVALVAAVVAGGSVLAGTGRDGHRTAPVAPPPSQVGWAKDDTVYVGTGGQAARMPEVAQTLYYTSAGVLVRTNKDGSSDGGAPFHFRLVAPDGTVSRVGVTLGEVVPSTDAGQPYLAWATMSGGQIQVVVHDVTTDRDVATVDVPGTFTWAGWEAPPVALSGDQVYVGTDDRTVAVDWRTGAVATTAVLHGSQVPEVSGGRTVIIKGRGADARAEIVDAATGDDLLDIPIAAGDDVSLSPDGRSVKVVEAAFDPPVRTKAYDVDSGGSVRLPDTNVGYGWTSDGDLFGVDRGTLTTCGATTGHCRSTTVPDVGRGFVRYAGVAYES